jgi:phosphoserine phosphatase
MRKNHLSLCLAACLAVALPAFAKDPLPSWNDTPLKASLIEFVNTVTKEGGPGYIVPADRIAVFDNDGTLCSEQPMYTQFAFGQDRTKEQASAHPEWKEKQPFKAALENDTHTLGESEIKGLTEIVAGTHAGKTTEELEASVNAWLATAKHPTLNRPYTELVYQPMLELLDYLRANGFRTYIVTGSVTEFLRAWAERVYGIPPEHIIGSTVETKLAVDGGTAKVTITGEPAFLNNRDAKALAIDRAIGRRPILAMGNSDGDLALIRLANGSKTHWTGIIHHTDAEREFSYNRESHFGRLDKGLTEAGPNTWRLVDMQKEWKTVFPPAKE